MTQTTFTAGLLDPAHPAPQGLTDGQNNPAGRRFDVYRNNVAASLTEALIAAFPVIYKLVGDKFFRATADVYWRNHPPKSPRLVMFGDQMPGFLRGFDPAKSLPYLPDIARLEIAMRGSYHAAKGMPLPPETLKTLSFADLTALRVDLAPTAFIVTGKHPIFDIYRFNTQPIAPQPRAGAQIVLITRPDFDPEQHLLTPDEARFTAALRDGQSLGAALALAASVGCDAAPTLTTLLRSNALVARKDNT